MVHMLDAFAEFEASLIKERVVAGSREAKRKGVQLGRPKTVDHKRVRDLKAQGLLYREMAAKVGCSKAGLFKILKTGL